MLFIAVDDLRLEIFSGQFGRVLDEEATSFVPVPKKPSTSHKEAAVGPFNNGDTIRTDRHRYTLSTAGNGKVLGRMLYDHVEDPGENVNIAGRPELAAAVQRLETRLPAEMGKSP